MSNKKNFEYNKDLVRKVDTIYFHKAFAICIHKKICLDKRDLFFKCTDCFTIFLFNKKDFKSFRKRIINEFDFQKAEEDLKKKIAEEDIDCEDELKTYYDLY